IDRLGSFDMIGILKNNKMKMQLFVPDTVKESPRTVENAVAAILKRNGLSADVTMSPKVREISVQEVFPEIREEERSINVSV
ncbi:MAG: hypothetical protein LIV24_08340, partial [Eubacterium sp.]|nr:hypothetical protein [Eubacterium sp.]